jgi:gamma-glutamyl phosphate reductase
MGVLETRTMHELSTPEKLKAHVEGAGWPVVTPFVANGDALEKTGGMSDMKTFILDFGRRARAASRQLARMSAPQKNAGLLAMADEILAAQPTILAANARDVEQGKSNGLSGAMLDRLTLNEKRLAVIAEGIREVAALPDPVGEVIRDWTRPNGLRITKVRVPIGVIGIIYESRPNVTSDAAVLCTKTGNATILRGGSESIHSNVAIAEALACGGAKAGLPADAILLIPVTDREAVKHLCEMDQYLDCIVPRGGKGLIETVVSHARMPVIKHYDGICIIYADKDADLGMAEKIVLNAKCQRPGVQRDRDGACASGHRGKVFRDNGRRSFEAGCGAEVRWRGNANAKSQTPNAKRQTDRRCKARRLSHGVSRSDSRGESGRFAGGGDRAHRGEWLAP